MKQQTITDKQIRTYLELRPDTMKVTIRRNGDVIIRTNKRRGDGGRAPWNMFAGRRDDIAYEVAQHLADWQAFETD